MLSVQKSVERFGAAMIPIFENYAGYRPPRYAYRAIAQLLSRMPTHYLSGLQSVVLTSGSAIGKGKTGRVAGKKYARKECLGFYHPKLRGEQAWIEIVVDNIVAHWFAPGMLRFLAYIPPFRDMAFTRTVYHEVGHHLDCTIGAPAPSGEAAAEAWMKKLGRAYFRRRYWYLVPFLGPVQTISKWIIGNAGDGANN